MRKKIAAASWPVRAIFVFLLLAPCLTADLRTVTKVVDGDSLQLSHGEKARLIGVDNPKSINMPGFDVTSIYARPDLESMKESIDNLETHLVELIPVISGTTMAHSQNGAVAESVTSRYN